VRTNLDIYVFNLDSVLEYSIEFPIYKRVRMGLFFICGVLTPFSAVFELLQWRPALVVEEAEYPERTIDPGQATGKLYHLRLRVECILFVIYKAGHEPTPYW